MNKAIVRFPWGRTFVSCSLLVSVHVVAVRETCSLVSMPRMIKAHEHHPTFPT